MMQQILYYDYGFGGHLLDYLQGRLYDQLIAGKAYCVSFYVVNEHHSQYAINHIGAYFDDGSIDTITTNCGYYQTAYSPQIVDTPVIYDTVNWTKIQGSFIANGTEKFITIGNYFDTSGTTHVAVNYTHLSHVGEYLIDDVSVIAIDDTANAGPDRVTTTAGDSVQIGDTTGYLPCQWYANGVLIDSNTAGFLVHPDSTTRYVMVLDVCGHITTDTAVVWVFPSGVQNINNSGMVANQHYSLSPNPNNGKIVLQQNLYDDKEVKIEILNSIGKNVYSDKINFVTKTYNLDIGCRIEGGYLLKITDSKGSVFTIKFTIIK